MPKCSNLVSRAETSWAGGMKQRTPKPHSNCAVQGQLRLRRVKGVRTEWHFHKDFQASYRFRSGAGMIDGVAGLRKTNGIKTFFKIKGPDSFVPDGFEM